MSRLRLNKVATPATPASNKGEFYYSSTLSPATPAFVNESGIVSRLGGGWAAGATAAVGGGFAADTYMGAAINVGTVGSWSAGMVYKAVFDMTKTAAGIATPIVIVRMGTLGTVAGDAAILTFTHTAGTAAIDTGVFEITVEFRSVGSGTAAVIAGVCELKHNLASTGLTSGGTAGYEAKPVASAGFNSTTSNIIGVSFNGGASFVGTNVMSAATLSG